MSKSDWSRMVKRRVLRLSKDDCDMIFSGMYGIHIVFLFNLYVMCIKYPHRAGLTTVLTI